MVNAIIGLFDWVLGCLVLIAKAFYYGAGTNLLEVLFWYDFNGPKNVFGNTQKCVKSAKDDEWFVSVICVIVKYSGVESFVSSRINFIYSQS